MSLYSRPTSISGDGPFSGGSDSLRRLGPGLLYGKAAEEVARISGVQTAPRYSISTGSGSSSGDGASVIGAVASAIGKIAPPLIERFAGSNSAVNSILSNPAATYSTDWGRLPGFASFQPALSTPVNFASSAATATSSIPWSFGG